MLLYVNRRKYWCSWKFSFFNPPSETSMVSRCFILCHVWQHRSPRWNEFRINRVRKLKGLIVNMIPEKSQKSNSFLREMRKTWNSVKIEFLLKSPENHPKISQNTNEVAIKTFCIRMALEIHKLGSVVWFRTVPSFVGAPDREISSLSTYSTWSLYLSKIKFHFPLKLLYMYTKQI